jgi:hypothetical protein
MGSKVVDLGAVRGDVVHHDEDGKTQARELAQAHVQTAVADRERDDAWPGGGPGRVILVARRCSWGYSPPKRAI